MTIDHIDSLRAGRRGSADRLASRWGLDHYRASVAESIVPLDIHSDDPDAFRGGIECGSFQDLHGIRIATSAHSVARTPEMIEVGGENFLKLSLVERGSVMLVQDGRDCLLSAGDMAVYNTARPYTLVCDSSVEMSIVMFPASLVTMPTQVLDAATARSFTGDFALSAIARPMISSLARWPSKDAPQPAHRVVRGAMEIFGALIEGAVPVAPKRSERDALMVRVRDFIEQHLSDPELTPARIAAAHFISLRTLYSLFVEEGTTVGKLIRTRRLERCYDDLAAPLNAHLSVSAIAREHGFIESTQFSRAFRTHFGIAPSSVRKLVSERTLVA